MHAKIIRKEWSSIKWYQNVTILADSTFLGIKHFVDWIFWDIRLEFVRHLIAFIKKNSESKNHIEVKSLKSLIIISAFFIHSPMLSVYSLLYFILLFSRGSLINRYYLSFALSRPLLKDSESTWLQSCYTRARYYYQYIATNCFN